MRSSVLRVANGERKTESVWCYNLRCNSGIAIFLTGDRVRSVVSLDRWAAHPAEALWKKDASVATEEVETGESPKAVTRVPRSGTAGSGASGIEEAISEKDRQLPRAVRDQPSIQTSLGFIGG